MTRTELNQLRTGHLTSSKDFEDYGIKANHPYGIKDTEYGGVIFADGEIRLNDNEVRDDMLPFLSWSENKS